MIARYSTIASICLLVLLAGIVQADTPLRVHPDNPHWFLWRGRATALITSGEHYGAVLNQDFDYIRYLDTLQRDGLNYTRTFTGVYVEPSGAFGIQRNTLAPAHGRLLAPWARSAQPGYAGGGNKFDLERFNPAYFRRWHDFLRAASQRGIVVEVTLFSSVYSDTQWAYHPLNPKNNIQAVPVGDWRKLRTANNGSAMSIQQRFVRQVVRELNRHANLFFEIQNEPWSDNHEMGDMINPYMFEKPTFPNAVEITTQTSVAWQRAIARVILDEESRLPNQHLIAQNVANFRLALSDVDLVPEAKIVNFHYAYPEAITWNRGWDRVIGCDETGFAGRDDRTYRREAWNFVMSGGGLFDNLDYSFTIGKEDGTDTDNRAPGGGGPALRRQLGVLSRFVHSFDLAKLRPDRAFVQQAPGVVARVLSAPGYAYALYLQVRGPTALKVKLPPGHWRATWINVLDGHVLRETTCAKSDPVVTLASPDFDSEVALRIIRE